MKNEPVSIQASNCTICASPYAVQINKIHAQYPKMPYIQLARQLEGKLPEFKGINNTVLAQRLGRHFKGNHEPIPDIDFRNPDAVVDVRKELQTALENVAQKRITWPAFLEKLRVVAFQNMLDKPEAIKVKDLIAAEAVQTNKDKLRLQATELTFMQNFMMNIFGPSDVHGTNILCPHCGRPVMGPDSETIEGEVVEGTERASLPTTQ